MWTKVKVGKGFLNCIISFAYCLFPGGLELEGVEVRVSVDSKDKTKVNDLLPKQVRFDLR